MRALPFLPLASLLYSTTVLAQQVTFSKVFSNYSLSAENGLNVVPLSDGYFLVGYNGCLTDSDLDCMTIYRLNSLGEIEWFKEYEHFGTRKKQIVIHEDKMYLSGRTNNQDYQFVLYCLDMEGNVLWQKEYGDHEKNEWSPGIILTSNEYLILYDSRDRDQNHMYEWLPVLLKINLQGDSLAEFNFNEQHEATSVRSLIESTDKDFIASYVYCPDACFLDFKGGVICLDTMGNTKWVLDLPFSYSPYGCLVNQIDSNTLAVKWHINSNLPNHDLTPPAIFFTDMFGNIQDTFIFENQSLKEAHFMEAVWEKGLVGCGSNYIDYLTLSNPPLAGWAFRMNEQREIVWDRTYLDTTYQGRSFGLNHIVPTSDGGYIATGTITNWMTGVWESHNWILKLDSMGCLSPGCDDVNYVTTTTESVFLKGKDIRIYPNPASDFVQLEFPEEIPLSDLFVHIVSNTGKLIKTTQVNSSLENIELPSIPAGVYFVVVRQKNEILLSKKLVVNK